MNEYVLFELAKRWDAEAVAPQCEDGSERALIDNAVAKGERQAKRECADTLRTLIAMLGTKPGSY